MKIKKINFDLLVKNVKDIKNDAINEAVNMYKDLKSIFCLFVYFKTNQKF